MTMSACFYGLWVFVNNVWTLGGPAWAFPASQSPSSQGLHLRPGERLISLLGKVVLPSTTPPKGLCAQGDEG